MKPALFSLFALLLLAACGGRSGPGQGYRDGSKTWPPWDQGVLPRDKGPHLDHPFVRDLTPIRDRTVKDACLPIPAKQVTGTYKGSWKGTWFCPGLKGESISGSLTFGLSPAGSPDNFNVSGKMNGTVAPVMAFTGSINGKMGCAALNAAMPDIKVSSGALIYQLTGTMNGLFTVKAGSPHGFRNGTWKATEPKLKCNASGTWEAAYAGP